ncbi:UCP020217 [Desulfonema limicola]|uniref:UCP020217 n=2 Tax=Desulfonema limicola TaxID=45656 RepID=A0A975GFJ2_9BACT|nr:UCP020217 [Desulfonema limicola]
MYREKKGNILGRHRNLAWKLAEEAAGLLKKLFCAQKVVVFGSLTSETNFTEWSDIDLAAWGLPLCDYYKAVAAVTGLSPDFEINLVVPGMCSESLLKKIMTQGIAI